MVSIEGISTSNTSDAVGHVGAPHLVRPVDHQLAQQIWVNTVLWMRITRARSLVDRR